LDLPALAFAAGLVLFTGILFGLAPALQATRPSLAVTLKDEDARGGTGRRVRSGRSLLAAAEVALALVLLAGSGLMLRSLGNLLGVSPGVDPRGVLTLRLGGRTGYPRDSLPSFQARVRERLAAIPGVTGVAMGDCPPLNGGCNSTSILLRDRAPSATKDMEVGVHWISPSWPSVMRVPLLRGRALSDADRAGAPKVVLVSQSAARRLWPNEDPIGKPLSVGQGGFWDDTARVAGVVGDVRFDAIDSPPKADVYISYNQSPSQRVMVYVRTAGDPLALVGPARSALREIAPDAPVFEVRTMESRVGDAMAFARMSAVLLAAFAGVALALATLGVYGVVSFGAAERTREMGVRAALGATRGDVARLVLRQGLGIAAAGAALGLAGALAATRVLRSLLYDVAPSDPLTFAAIVALLLATVLLASWTPARRASRVAPAEVLRNS
jgi:putative ABC transport system permease protein